MPDKPFNAQIRRKTPDTPTAECNDDHFTFSRNVKFTCSGHGGVKRWTYDTDITHQPEDGQYFED